MKSFDYDNLQKRLSSITYIVKHGQIQLSIEDALDKNLELSEEELKNDYIIAYYNYDNDVELSSAWSILKFTKRCISETELLKRYKEVIDETVKNRDIINNSEKTRYKKC